MTIRAAGRPSASTVASAIAVAVFTVLEASAIHASISGSGSAGSGSGNGSFMRGAYNERRASRDALYPPVLAPEPRAGVPPGPGGRARRALRPPHDPAPGHSRALHVEV